MFSGLATPVELITHPLHYTGAFVRNVICLDLELEGNCMDRSVKTIYKLSDRFTYSFSPSEAECLNPLCCTVKVRRLPCVTQQNALASAAQSFGLGQSSFATGGCLPECRCILLGIAIRYVLSFVRMSEGGATRISAVIKLPVFFFLLKYCT